MTSGTMWCRIRDAAYSAMDRSGKPQYYVGGMNTQVIAEAHILIILNAIAAISMIALTIGIPKIRNKWANRILTFVCSTTLIMSFSSVVALFRWKTPHYPFRLVLQ